MAVHTQIVDGNQSLIQQENALNLEEQMTFAKVISYAANTGVNQPGTAPNQAVLEDVPIGQQPKPLQLQAVDLGTDPAPIIAQFGRAPAFQGTAFVSGKKQTVLGFR